MRIFDPNSPLTRALSKLSDIVLCNIMFCILSLPIVTIGASLTALYSAMQDIVDDKLDDIIFRHFWNSFRKNFKQATALWLISLAAVGFLALFYYVINLLGGTLGKVYLVTFFLIAIAFLFGFQYFFPMQARFQNKVRYTLRNSWLISVLALPWTLLSFLVDAAAIYVSFFMNPTATYAAIFIWGAAGFGLVAYLNSFFFRQAFKKVAPQIYEAPPDEGPPEEAVFTDEAHREQDLMVQESSFSDPNWNRREEPPKEEPKKTRRKRK